MAFHSVVDRNLRFSNDFLYPIIEFIAENFKPEDVFDSDDLEDWARDNDFILIEEAEDWVDMEG